MGIEDRLSVTALIVALVALLVSVIQLVGQFFSTAEGYRRCQPSVLGPWAKRTRLVWRWSQFRFEVKFTTANIVMRKELLKLKPLRSVASYSSPDIVDLDATGTRNTTVLKHDILETDAVSWIRLLNNLERQQLAATNQQWTKYKNTTKAQIISSPAMSLREWSWDLMPIEISRPTATTTLGTLIVIAHRLGMVWRDLRPSEGFLRAEGNGQTFTATTVKGFGLLVQYSVETRIFQKSLDVQASLRIPTEDADKLGCGIIPGCSELGTPDIACLAYSAHGQSDDKECIKPVLSEHYSMPESHIIDVLKADGVVYDFMFMSMSFLSPYGSGMVEVFNPLKQIDLSYSYMRLREMRLVLRTRLKQYTSRYSPSSTHLTRLANHLDEFASRHGEFFVNSITFERRHLYPAADVIDHCHGVWDELTMWFKACQDQQEITYADLVADFLVCNAHSMAEARENINEGNHRDDHSIVSGNRSPTYIELSHIYADKVDTIKDRMIKRGYRNETLIAEAVWTLMIRAIYCSAPLVLLPAQSHPAVTSDFWESGTPVYMI